MGVPVIAASFEDASPDRAADRAPPANTKKTPERKRAAARELPTDETDIGPSNDY
jgi:hypothetical protein